MPKFKSRKAIVFISLPRTCRFRITTDFLLSIFKASYYDSLDHENVKNDESRNYQVQEAANYVASKLLTDSNHHPALLTGDFNVNSRMEEGISDTSNPEYLDMMNKISTAISSVPGYDKPVDVIKQQYGYHPITFGDVVKDSKTGNLIPREKELTHPADLLCQLCLDYLIWIQPKAGKVFRIKESKVEPFFVEKEPFSQLSDHYGLSTEIALSAD
jgi:hypothetical protein